LGLWVAELGEELAHDACGVGQRLHDGVVLSRCGCRTAPCSPGRGPPGNVAWENKARRTQNGFFFFSYFILRIKGAFFDPRRIQGIFGVEEVFFEPQETKVPTQARPSRILIEFDNLFVWRVEVAF
jgi:hypothetical protein